VRVLLDPQEGYRFLSHARKILDAVSDATRTLKNSNTNLKGRVRLGVLPTVGAYFLPTPLMNFQRLYPNVDVEIAELERAEIEQGLFNESLDLGIMLMSGLHDQKRIKTETLFSSRRRIWLGSGHRLTAVPSIHLSDLLSEKYLLLDTDDNAKTTFGYWQRHKLKPNVYFRTTTIETIRNLVAVNAGITILSDMVYRPWSLQGERIEARMIADEIPELRIGIAWKKDAQLSSCAKEFCDFCLTGGNNRHSYLSQPQHRPSHTVQRERGRKSKDSHQIE
jgi:DNA-binding transcriptional LysR family regulator